MIKVKDIIERVLVLYNDQDYARISQKQYLQFLDDALTQLVLSRPDAHVKTSIEQLITGTRQSLPADGSALIDIYLNRPGGTGIGSPVLQVERKDLDYFSSWHEALAEDITEINEYAYDIRSPRTFWVSPPVGGIPVYVEMDYAYNFDSYADQLESDTYDNILEMDIPVEVVFKGPIVNYMLMLLYSTDSSSAHDRTVSQKYEQMFYQALGLEYQASVVIAPEFTMGVSTNV